MRNTSFLAALLLGCAFAAGVALALDTKQIVGSYAIASDNLTDPGPDDRPDRVLFYFDGATARDMYARMPARPAKSVCDAGLLSKQAGDLQCTMDTTRGEYTCSVGIMLGNGKTANASAC
ncbi:hypothetical protein [Arenimonas oryziterrae]|uniref:Uncharacterized protein n=1 Tax=Arenimonas oryziterrae DSM 21050 = YC6267 TaxID=1121015 RepID=A0A091ANS3_9GAMM|nr:hypothetical protein [Arenimonas oryziterrae]KFN41001.1 hypothetical protein N789_03725 [Arenimonas oryziterrae DSM 21050 = YC6267]